jgi:hypothetical protein
VCSIVVDSNEDDMKGTQSGQMPNVRGDKQLTDCCKVALEGFVQQQARQNADRDVGITHVAVEEAGCSAVLAYYSLVTRFIDSAVVPDKKLPRGDIGVVLLGRLAIDIRQQNKGLGRLCLTRAILQVERSAREIGIYALILDAKDDEANNWNLNLNFGLTTLLGDPNHLNRRVETIRRIVTELDDDS